MSKIKIFFLVIGVSLIVFGTFLFTTYGPNLLSIEKGELLPFSVDDTKEIEIQLGGVTSITSINQLKSGYDFSHDVYIEGFDYPIQISYDDKRLIVYAKIKNIDGEVVAEIANNKWVVNPNPIVAYDRNYNSYAFEVKASNQVPILQVVMTPQNKIIVGGVFYGENRTLLAMLNGTTRILGSGYSKNTTDIVNSYNQTLFQYPSDSNLGRFIDNSPFFFTYQPIFSPNDIILVGYVLFGVGSFITSLGFDSIRKFFKIYTLDIGRGYNAGKKLEITKCREILRNWNKLEKQFNSNTNQNDSESLKSKKNLELKYNLFWTKNAMSYTNQKFVSERYVKGFKKAVIEKCVNS